MPSDVRPVSAETLTALLHVEWDLRSLQTAAPGIGQDGPKLTALQVAVDEALHAIHEWREAQACQIWLHDGSGHCSVHDTTFHDGREDCRVAAGSEEEG